jgi:hypothetical protein
MFQWYTNISSLKCPNYIWFRNVKPLKHIVMKKKSQIILYGSCPIWKTVKIGTYLSKEALGFDLLKKMNNSNGIDEWAGCIFESTEFKLHNTEEIIALVKLSVKDLGFKEMTIIKRVFVKALKNGFKLCPPETILQLCMQYLEELTPFLLAMEPINDIKERNSIFRVRNEKNCNILSGTYGVIDNNYISPDDYFVFCKPTS